MQMLLFGLLILSMQAAGQIAVKVGDAAATTISADDLSKMPRHTATLNDDGKQVNYEGVLMHDVLAKAGVDFGKQLHGNQLSTYVLAIANDGYEVVFALAEFDPTVMDSGVIVADKREAAALGSSEGPLRLVVPQDKRPTRSVRLLKEIDVVQLKK